MVAVFRGFLFPKSLPTLSIAAMSPVSAGAVYWKPARKPVRLEGSASSTWETRSPREPVPGRGRPWGHREEIDTKQENLTFQVLYSSDKLHTQR